MSFSGRKTRASGSHRTSAQPAPNTVPDTAEEPMTATDPQPGQVAPDDFMDDLLAAYERAQQRKEMAESELPAIEDQIRTGVAYADKLRAEAQAARQEAAEAEQKAAAARDEAKGKDEEAEVTLRGVETYGRQLRKLRDMVTQHQATAAYHGAYMNREIAAGAEDPKIRRARKLAEAAQKNALQSQTGFPGPSPLDGPNPPLGPDPTAPFPHHPRPSVDDLQKTPAAGAES